MASRIPLYLDFLEGNVLPFDAGDTINPTYATNVGGGGSGTTGQASIVFESFDNEKAVTVSHTGVTSASAILVSLVADNDDVLSTEWAGPYVCNFQTNSFDILIRCLYGEFLGEVKVNYSIL